MGGRQDPFATSANLSGRHEEIVLPSAFGPVGMKSKGSFGISASRVVPSYETKNRWHEEHHAHPEFQQKKAVKEPEGGTDDVRRQKLAKQLWQAQEEDLSRRVTMLENLIRRTVDLPAYDTIGVAKQKKRFEIKDDYENYDQAHSAPFSSHFEGPLSGPKDWQVRDANGVEASPQYYVSPPEARMQGQSDYLEACRTVQFRAQHPVTMALAGDCQYLGRALYLDPIDDFYNPGMLYGVTVGPSGAVYPRLS